MSEVARSSDVESWTESDTAKAVAGLPSYYYVFCDKCQKRLFFLGKSKERGWHYEKVGWMIDFAAKHHEHGPMMVVREGMPEHIKEWDGKVEARRLLPPKGGR